MLVEDDEMDRHKIIQYLKKLDASIIECVSGKEALRAIEQSTPHLIITDILMSAMDGFVLLELLKSDSKTASIPVIIITSQGEVETREKAFMMGADDFISKPFEIDDLLPKVNKYIV